MPGIFISYRRDDTSGYSGRLHDHLSRRFGRSRIFLDIDDIPIGQDFARVLSERIASCDVVIVLIGKRWQTLADRSGRLRLDDPADFVRLEIATALQRGIPIIPVLVEGARMPSAGSLPGSISRLADLNAFEISDRFFEASLERLARQISPWLKRGGSPWWTLLSALQLDAPSRRVAAIAGVLLALLVFGLAFSSFTGQPRPQSHSVAAETAAHAPKAAPPEIAVPSVEDRIPPRIAELPKIVEAARGGFAFEDATGVTGPVNPKLIWSALFKRERPAQWAVAGDGTLYLSPASGVQHPALVAIRDGKEQWAYEVQSLPRFQIMLDGRIWGYSEAGRMLSFNTLGEGGRTASNGKSETALESEILTARLRAHGYNLSNSDQIPQCRLDQVTGYLQTSESNGSPGRDTWKMRLDGDCVASAGDRRGNALLATETGTIYSVSPEGRTRWTYKSDCKVEHIFPLLGDESIYLCADSFFGLRSGKRQWKLDPTQIQTLPVNPILFDKANTIYLASSKPGASVIAIDHDGAVLWTRDFGKWVTPQLLDKEGRLYVSWGGDSDSFLGIACLSDR